MRERRSFLERGDPPIAMPGGGRLPASPAPDPESVAIAESVTLMQAADSKVDCCSRMGSVFVFGRIIRASLDVGARV
jgi:hypothetical protein